jgi:hypothetical protein
MNNPIQREKMKILKIINTYPELSKALTCLYIAVDASIVDTIQGEVAQAIWRAYTEGYIDKSLKHKSRYEKSS